MFRAFDDGKPATAHLPGPYSRPPLPAARISDCLSFSRIPSSRLHEIENSLGDFHQGFPFSIGASAVFGDEDRIGGASKPFAT